MPVNDVSTNFPAAAFDKNASGPRAGADKKTVKGADESEREVQKLSQRDREVRAHEAAHVAAGGQYVKGGATFQYQKGPDGKMYAVGGEVSIDASPVKNDPQATIIKMQAIKRAAMAPADPSGQDRAVASAAAAAESQARQESAKKAAGGNETGAESVPQGMTDNKASRKTASYTMQGGAIPFSKEPRSSMLNLIA